MGFVQVGSSMDSAVFSATPERSQWPVTYVNCQLLCCRKNKKLHSPIIVLLLYRNFSFGPKNLKVKGKAWKKLEILKVLHEAYLTQVRLLNQGIGVSDNGSFQGKKKQTMAERNASCSCDSSQNGLVSFWPVSIAMLKGSIFNFLTDFQI